MKKVLLLCVAAVLFFQVGAAQAFSWQFKAHNPNMQVLEREINAMFASGYVPVGMSFLQGECNILYLNVGDTPQGWYLEKYADQYQLEQGLNRMANNGYTPMGLSQYRGDFWVIYILDDQPINQWAIITSRLSLQSLKNEIQPYVNQGMLPFGMGSTSQQFLTLLVNSPTMSASEWVIEGYRLDRNVIQQGLDRNINMGRVPWGFLHHAGQIYVVYLRPS